MDHQLCGIDMLQLGAMIFDNVTRFVLPLCSAISDRRLRPSNGDAAAASSVISSAVIIVDASSLTLMQGFDLRGFARDISGLLTTCYPETVDRIFVWLFLFVFLLYSFLVTLSLSSALVRTCSRPSPFSLSRYVSARNQDR